MIENAQKFINLQKFQKFSCEFFKKRKQRVKYC